MSERSNPVFVSDADTAFMRKCIWLLDPNRHRFPGTYCDHIRELAWRCARPDYPMGGLPEQALHELHDFLGESHADVSGELIAEWSRLVAQLRSTLSTIHVYRFGGGPKEWIQRHVFLMHIHDSGRYASLRVSQGLLDRLRKNTPAQGKFERWILEDLHDLNVKRQFVVAAPADQILTWGLQTLDREGRPKPKVGFHTPYSLARSLVDTVRDSLNEKDVVGTVMKLLDLGADVSATAQIYAAREWNETVLHEAIGWRDDDAAARTVSLLIEHGADVNARALRNRTALHDACTQGKVAAAAVLVEKGASTRARNSSGETPLLCAITRRPEHAAVALTSALLASSADPNARARNGDLPLHRAARNGLCGVVTLLLEAGADPNRQGVWGYTALYEAVSSVALIDEAALPTIVTLLPVSSAKDPKDDRHVSATEFLRRLIQLSTEPQPAAEIVLKLLEGATKP